MRETVNAYAEKISTAKDAYNSRPVVTQEYFEAIDTALTTICEQNEGTDIAMPATVDSMTYDNGTFTFPVSIFTTDEFSQKYPALLVQYIYDTYGDQFAFVEYTGYTAVEVEDEDNPSIHGFGVNFDLILHVNNEKQLPDFEAMTAVDETAVESGEGAVE